MTEIDLTPVTRLEYDIDAILNDHAVAEPITRIELILADIVAGNTTTVEPVTRIETYLAIISGADYPVPEPVTRIETFLAIITGEDYETPEAVTRLEGLLAEWVEKGSGIWKTVTGTLIHITDALASPMQKCEVSLEPIQDLHGQDAPYPAGGGKNKFSSDNGTYGLWISSSGAESSTASAYVGDYVNVEPSSSYTVKRHGTGEFYSLICAWYDESNTFISRSIVYADINPETFTSPSNAKKVRIGVSIASGTITKSIIDDCKIQFEAGSTATTYSPYSNICPITGWTGCEVTRAGLNICVVKNLYIGGVSGLAIGNDGVLACFNGINGQTYRISGLSGDRNILYKFRGKMDDIKSGASMSVAIGSPSLPYVFTADETCIYCFYRNSTWSESIANSMKVTIGDSATDYEALNIATASVTFPDSAGTVYGGTLDLVSGVLTVDRAKIVFDGTQTELSGINWRSNSDSVGFYYNFSGLNIASPSAISIVTEAIADSVKAVPYDVIYSNHICSFAILNTSGIERICVRITDTTLTTKELINAYLAQNPITICYPLATPTEIQLTPQEISTLKGVNNVWSNSNGDTTIIYKAQAE